MHMFTFPLVLWRLNSLLDGSDQMSPFIVLCCLHSCMSCFDEDYSLGFPDIDEPPCSPIKAVVHVSSQGPVVNEHDRERESRILSLMHSKHEEALRKHD